MSEFDDIGGEDCNIVLLIPTILALLFQLDKVHAWDSFLLA